MTYALDASLRTLLLPLLAAIFAVASTIYLLRNNNAIPALPGPALAAYTDLWRVFRVAGGQFQQTSIRLHRRFGPIVRTGPRHVSLADPKLISVVYGTKPIFRKSGFYPLQSITWQRKPAMNIFSTQDVPHHRNEKRRMAPAYSMTAILQSEASIDSTIRLFLSRLGNKASEGDVIDLSDWLHYFALDAISEITFGEGLGFLEQGKDIGGWIAETKGMMAYFAVCGQIPWLHRFLLGNPILLGLMKPMETWSAPLLFTTKKIDEFESNKSSGQSTHMMDRWITGADEENSNKERMNRKSLVVNLATNLFAGADTTAVAMTAILNFLCKHPAAMRRCVEEVDHANRGGSLSSVIQYQETKSLPFLGAVVKESMRLHPSVGLILEREVPAEGLVIGDVVLPSGTIVGINPWVTGRDPTIFPDPDAFKPVRWIESDADRLAAMDELFEFNFGAGTTKCLGKNVSLLEVYKLVPQLLREYELELAEPGCDLQVSNYWFAFTTGLKCRVRKREA